MWSSPGRCSRSSAETSGIPAIYALKSMILAFVVLIAFQGLSLAFHALLTLAGRQASHDDIAEAGGGTA